MAFHVKSNFDLKSMKRKLGFRERPRYVALSREPNDDDANDEDKHLGSPSSIVYGSSRGEHRFVLEFPRDNEDQDRLSPVLLEREPLLFDTNMNS